MKHLRRCQDFACISFEVSDVKAGGCLAIESLDFKQIFRMIFGVEKNVRWHLSISIAIKCYAVFPQPPFQPFLYNIAHHVLLPDDNVNIAKEESDLSLGGFYFIDV